MLLGRFHGILCGSNSILNIGNLFFSIGARELRKVVATKGTHLIRRGNRLAAGRALVFPWAPLALNRLRGFRIIGNFLVRGPTLTTKRIAIENFVAAFLAINQFDSP